jgi:cytochrome c-type biogenesis protein
MELLLVSFLAGVLTALAPCVLPLIPVIVGGSLSGNDKKRPYYVTASLFFSIIIFTLLLKASTTLIDIPENFWRYTSGGIIILFAITLLWPKTWEAISTKFGLFAKSNQLLGKSFQKQGAAGAMLAGFALGPVFSSCSPVYLFILATTLPQNFLLGFSSIVLYALGLCLVLFLAATLGQKFIAKFAWASDTNGWFKRLLGVLLIVAGVLIVTGWDRQLQLWVIETGYLDITRIEQRLLPK